MNTAKLQETYWSLGPWVTPEYLYHANKIYGGDQTSYYPKLYGFIEYTDVISGIGYLNIVNTALPRRSIYTYERLCQCSKRSDLLV